MTKTATNQVTTKAPEKVPAKAGKPKSGRIWKTSAKRASSIVRAGVKPMSIPWEKKEQIRLQKQLVKEKQAEVTELRIERLRNERRLREERQARRMANEFKNASYQVLKDPTKIKGMSKKQLRMIKKTQVNKLGQVELVNPWSGK